MDNYSRDELLEIGFSQVGENVTCSRDVRFYAIEGSLGDNVRIDTYSVITGHVELGDYVHISPLCFLSATGGKIVMQANSGIGPHVALLTKSDDYTAPDLDSADKLSGDIVIGERTIIGSGSKIFPGVNIGADASIGSNCLVTNNVAAGDMIVSRGAATIAMGNRLQD